MKEEFSYNYGDYFNSDKFVKMRFDISKKLLEPYINGKAKILDIGCYDGAMLEVLKRGVGKIDYTGVDTDVLALDIALKRGAKISKVNFETADLPFDDDSFDVIIMAEILEHLRNPLKLMEKAKRLLKQNGVILVSLPNECTLYHRFKMLFGRGLDGMGFEPGYHLHFPTLKQDRELVTRYFKIIKEDYWYHLGVGGLLERILNMIPERIIKSIVKLQPALFSRGVIILCQK